MGIKKQIEKVNKKVAKEVDLRRARSARSFPATSFFEALTLAQKMFEFGSGQPVRRLSLFDHLGRSPESGPSRQLITNANKYGIIKGGYQAEIIELTPDGLRAVDSELPLREQTRSKVKLAVEDIDVFQKLYQRFEGKTLPAKAALIDAAKEFGVDDNSAPEAVDTFIVNLRDVGLLQTLSGAERIVSVDHLLDTLPSASPKGSSHAIIKQDSREIITSEKAHFESTCFYITPIGDEGTEQRKHSDLFLGSFIEPALETFQLKVIRADTIDKPGIISRQVIEYIVHSRLVIVDLSYHNPNVFYELALRHMMRLPVVQIIRSGEKIPFDINQMRTIQIDISDVYTLVPKIDTYRAEIGNQVRRALESPDAVDTPISVYFPNLKTSF